MVKKKLYFDRFNSTYFFALTEGDSLVEYEMENEKDAEIVGNIYKGKVVNVLSGMDAAFVYCGLPRNCYLSLGDVPCEREASDLPDAPAPPCEVKEGDEILVQVVKSPRGGKGAKVTTRLSFVGKDLIFMPDSEFIGVSHKIADEELREQLARKVTELRGTNRGGYVVRTGAPYSSEAEIKSEMKLLRRSYEGMLEKSKTAAVGEAVFVEGAMPARVMRNVRSAEVESVVVGDRKLFDQLRSYVSHRENMLRKIKLYTGERDLFYSSGISEQIAQMLTPRVDLPNGAYLIIERTEALTSIDVNTGKYVGDDGLELTAFTTNLLAAREIATQVRLRNIGGIVVVDFIDMTEEAHRKQVVEELNFYLARDRVKVRVLPMSELGLVEFTRKRTSNEAVRSVTRPCPYCSGTGEIVQSELTIIKIKRDIMDCYADGYHTAIVELNDYIMKEILQGHLFTEYIKGIWAGKRLYFVPHRTFHEQQYLVKGDNSGVLNLPDKAQIAY
ncbi:MAG: Rne/Rng family ribonuclease [Christensenellaceae bacterium]